MGTDRTRPGTVRIAVVIPWRDKGDPDRQAAYAYTHAYYRRLGVDTIVTDDGATTGPFNRHRAYNRGLARTDADVILWNEADTLIPSEQITAAATLALAEPGIVIPYTERHELNATQSRVVYQGADPFGLRGAVVYPDGCSIGQAGVTSRRTLDLIGGMWDEGFAGWGYDDNAAFLTFARLAGPPRWVQGKGVHLWHEPAFNDYSPEREAATAANAERFARMRDMTDDQIRALTSGQLTG